MKMKKIIINLAWICALILVAGVIIEYNWYSNRLGLFYNVDASNNPQIEYFDSLQFALRTINNEEQKTRTKITEFENGSYISMSIAMQGIGIISDRIFDPQNKALADSIDGSKKYILLSYWGFSNNEHSLYSKYIIHTVHDSAYIAKIIKDQHSNKYFYSNFYPVNYSYISGQNSNRKGIIIPIKNNFVKTIMYITVYFSGLLALLMIGSVVINSIIVMLNISRNKIFIDINLYRLRWMSIACFVLVLFPYLISLIFYLIYFKELYPDVSFTHSFWDGDYKWCFAGAIYLLLFLAFRKGYKLQQEQDLTI